ncbi:MAG TPA: MerR family transcriptional regulator [Actinomycetota bacterium]|nr:MerR family transcriptional regulator [Actinomycetota bacterium]
MARRNGRSDDRAVYIISVAAELAGVHPQTLRIYERKGLLRPARTAGNTRRYSERDIERLRMIQLLTQQGVNLAGVKMIMDLQSQLERAHRRLEEMDRQLRRTRRHLNDQVERMRQRQRADLIPLRSLRLPWER